MEPVPLSACMKIFLFTILLASTFLTGCKFDQQYTNLSQVEKDIPSQTLNQFTISQKAKTSDLKEIPEQARKFVPRNGFTLISGGLTSSGMRIVVDFDHKTLVYAMSKTPNSSPYDESLETKEVELSQAKFDTVNALIKKIWVSPKDFMHKGADGSPEPMADVNVILILSDNGTYRMIESYGLPVDEVAELYELLP